MKKNGFTLIELLAVIIILAVIALIATPIVLNVVDNAKESARQSSISGYADATQLAIYDAMYLQDGKELIIDKEWAKLNVKKQGSDIECEEVKYSDNYGVVLNKCRVLPDDKEYCFAFSKTYSDCAAQEFQDIYSKIENEEVALTGNPISNYAKKLVYDNNACKTDDTTYQYMNGCYLKGQVNNNYVWYSGFLWRIMGINEDGTVRLITEENVTGIPYNIEGNVNFNGNHVDKWLNEYFPTYLKGTSIIKDAQFCQGELSGSNTTARQDCTGGQTFTRKFGLISMDEYNLSGSKNSYLRSMQWFWTMSPYSDTNNGVVSASLNTSLNSKVDIAYGVRPVINVDANSIITKGNGLLTDVWDNSKSPYILNEKKDSNITGKLNEKVSTGEYVKFGNRIYRFVSNDGKGAKLILDGYYEESDAIYEMKFGSTKFFSTENLNPDDSALQGIGYKLNTDVYNWLTNNDNTLKNKVVNYTWYRPEFNQGELYTKSLQETGDSVQAKVGLIRVGEILSGYSYTILTKNGTVPNDYNNTKLCWSLTQATADLRVWGTTLSGASVYALNNTFALRPVIVVQSDLPIVKGNGTPSSPYEI